MDNFIWTLFVGALLTATDIHCHPQTILLQQMPVIENENGQQFIKCQFSNIVESCVWLHNKIAIDPSAYHFSFADGKNGYQTADCSVKATQQTNVSATDVAALQCIGIQRLRPKTVAHSELVELPCKVNRPVYCNWRRAGKNIRVEENFSYSYVDGGSKSSDISPQLDDCGIKIRLNYNDSALWECWGKDQSDSSNLDLLAVHFLTTTNTSMDDEIAQSSFNEQDIFQANTTYFWFIFSLVQLVITVVVVFALLIICKRGNNSQEKGISMNQNRLELKTATTPKTQSYQNVKIFPETENNHAMTYDYVTLQTNSMVLPGGRKSTDEADYLVPIELNNGQQNHVYEKIGSRRNFDRAQPAQSHDRKMN